jgi:DNA replicative helicase MCM subunit Mcm2 (Cdc46/Mcm family)
MRLDRIVMDDDAKQAWTLIYSALSEGKPALVGSITARSEAQVIRLALVYAMIDGSSSIRVEHLHAAIAVWEYAEESANCVFGNNSGNAVGDEISRALRATDDGLTRTQISQLFGKHKASIEISAALKELAAAGLIVQVVEKGPGRTPERWKEYVTATS